MTFQATGTIGTGDGSDVTDSGIYVPGRAGLDDLRPATIIENPARRVDNRYKARRRRRAWLIEAQRTS